MQTPSLAKRVVRSGVGVVALVILVLDVVVFFVVRAQLEQRLDEALTLRSDIAKQVASAEPSARALADQLASLAIPAEVRTVDGASVSATPAVDRNRPGEEVVLDPAPGAREDRAVPLEDGTVVTVFVSRTGVDATLRTLLVVLGVGTLAAVGAAATLFRRTTASSLEPLSQIVAAASRTADGQVGERLRPDDPATELGRLAIAYDRMLDALETAVAEARDSDEQSQRFLADAAHQLRTPLATVRASVELLVVDPDPGMRDEHLANLLRETARATRTLNALLRLARLDRGTPSRSEPIDLVELCQDEVDRAKSLSPHLEIDLRAPDSGAPVDGNRIGLHEALGNLLDNARRHAVSRVDVSLRDGPDSTVEVVIRDDGPGIAVEARNLVFERFATLDGKGGSGLGLPIARAIAEAHGGGLDYRDDGFVLTLPAETG